MWTLLVLCGVIATHGVQGGARQSGTTVPPRPQTTTPVPRYTVTAQPSCRNYCGYNRGSCSCSSSCRYNGNCCHDYYYHCSSYDTTPGSWYTTSYPQTATTAQPSCRNYCGYNRGSCSCSSSCRYNGNCCHDYYYHCSSYDTTPGSWYTTSYPQTATTAQPSCRNYCGYNRGSCSCSSSCRYNGNCCHDYSQYCSYQTSPPWYTTTAQPSCRNYCGYNRGSCSCSSSCRYNGNCCHDYSQYCSYQTSPPWYTTTAQPSCRYNCGYNLGSCSCSSSCEYYGNCCHDYYYLCQSSTTTSYPWQTTTASPSCRYNCGYNLGSCSCSGSCEYYGNCCHDYNYYCPSTTQVAPTTTAQPSCRNYCGYNMGSCSCSDSCRYNGNCCHDYYSYCQYTTAYPEWTTQGTAGPCGGSLFGSGNFSSPNHPGYYSDNSYCVWQLRAAYDQRISLSFMNLELENCCSCDYINIYDGPSVGSRLLGKVCNNTLNTFYSTSNYMTVLFRTDGSVVGRGFHAEFTSTLPPNSGRVDCSSDNMVIVIERSYLNSVGYDGHSLYLDDPHCRPQVSSYRVVFSFPINTCGTVRKFVNGRAVYTNNVRAYASQSGEITRQSNFKLSVGCRMEQDSVSQIMYRVGNFENSSIVGTGRFNTSMSFYTSSSFYQQVTEVPYKVALNQYMYVQVDLRRGDSSLVIFLDTCVASPSPHDFHSRPYYLVRNGCSVDSTYYAYISGSRAYARFRFKAFQFLRATDDVYIQCKVLICQQSDYNSRCRRGCTKRRTRDVGSEHDSQTLVLGPIQLKEPEKKEVGAEKQEKKQDMA